MKRTEIQGSLRKSKGSAPLAGLPAEDREESALDRMAAETDRVSSEKDRRAAAADRADAEDVEA